LKEDDLYERKYGNGYKSGWEVKLYDWDIVEKLMGLGIRPNKSKEGCLIESEFNNHLLRGLFDSDGCVTYMNGRKGLRVQIAGHPLYMEQIRKSYDFMWKVSFMGKLEIVSLFTQDEVVKFYKFIYSEASIFMNRKRSRFDEFYKGR